LRIMRRSPILLQPDSDQVYSPAEDSLLLLEVARQEITAADRVLEVGVGSGYVISGLPVCHQIMGTDCNSHAAMITHRTGVPVVRTDLAAGLRGPFDLILFNPPYLPTQPEDRIDDWLEYALDGGVTGREVIKRFLFEAKSLLSPQGRVLLLISSLTGVDECKELFMSLGWVFQVAGSRIVEGGENLLVYRLKNEDS
jgi:release factor glutamine methyltransferase